MPATDEVLPCDPHASESNFRRLIASDSLSLLALMVGQVALPWWIAQAGGAHDLAVNGVCTAAMSFVALPLLSPLADRHPKRSLIAAGLLLSALAMAGWAVLAAVGHYRLAAVLAIQGVQVMAMALFTPATNSIVTELVPPRRLGVAIGRQQSAQAMGRMIGPSVAGAALVAVGTAGTLALGALVSLAAAAVAMRMPAPVRAHPSPADETGIERAGDAAGRGGALTSGLRRWAGEFRVGLYANWAIPIERGWVLANFIAAIFLMPALSMMVPLKVQSLGLSARWLGGCEAALSLGLLAGSLWLSPIWVRLQGRFVSRVSASVVVGLALTVAGLTSNPWLLVAMYALVGISNATMTLVGKTHRMLARPPAFRARMSSGAVTTIQVAQTIGPALAGIALAYTGLRGVYACFGLLGAAASMGLAFVPGFRAFMALDHHEVENWYGREYPHVFASMGTPGEAPVLQRR